MIHCWAIGKKGITHRAIHRAVHRLRHHYHSLAVKIVAPAIVCVSTGAGLALWPASAPPVGGGIVVAFPPTAPVELTIPLQLSEFPAELPTFSINEMVPLAIEKPIDAPSKVALEPPVSVPEPSSALLLGAAISLFALIRHRTIHAGRDGGPGDAR